jgi:Domain of unknown function (DUF6285)
VVSETGPPPHDRPTATELVAAVRSFLEDDVMAATEGRVRFHARVAANALGMVEREMSLGPAQAAAHAEALARLGVADETELARAIRNGDLDDRLDEVIEVVRRSVRAKLEVANPRYLDEG